MNKCSCKTASLVLAILVMPIVVNFVLSCYNPLQKYIPVLGDDKTWILFWGSYIGAIVGAGMAYYILHQTLQENRKENQHNRQFDKNERLKAELIDCVCKLSFEQITTPVSQGRNFYKTPELNRLDELIIEADKLSKKVRLICYGIDEATSFVDNFETLILSYQNDCRKMYKAIEKLSEPQYLQIKDKDKTEDFNVLLQQITDKHNTEAQQMFEKVNEHLKKMIETLNNRKI